MRSPDKATERAGRVMRMIAAVLLVAMVAGACGRRNRDTETTEAGVEPVSGLVSGTVSSPDGSDRTYHLYVPSTAGDNPPLLVALHGGLGWGLQFRENSDFDRLAETNGFLVVYPDGTKILERRDNRVWNGGACCGPAQEDRGDVDDVAFITALIDELTNAYAVDPERIYVTGHSNGAIMSYRLACELSDRIVAIAVQAGSIEIDRCEPGNPVSVMNLHGLDDTNISIDGGSGDGVSDHDFASPRASIEQMASLNGCTERADTSDTSNDDVSGVRWTGCDDDVVVELILVDGANHAWMGHPGTWIQEQVTGAPYPDLDASLTIWDFLAERVRS
jgi:polyhydroxybutyrate depolymerase